MPEQALTFRNGHRVTLIDEGVDDNGPYLRLQHLLPAPKRQAGPHWHPELAEHWTIRAGRIRFRIDGTEVIADPGDTVTAPPRTVHEFWSELPDTVIDHEIRPPLRHWQMFQFWSTLDNAGKTTAAGLPRNPIALALLWDLQDGYLAKIPVPVQRVLLGGLARLARATGYHRRWLPLTDDA
ncbi:cupin domain-containing protein [Nocardia cyriacigeorgica]|uniref:Cupin domain-containing protein n=1 Tax=Nocardia cyriacigeorgica TaxID=135487 RepID=A0A6P1D6M2_9NOCA|nr:cupin domain-containing protein [Nocardia cyriacigeorgica]NEW41511.1 cupin domain-containing protein [Nocardia cyriacigeorgica]NEW45718.1 cupin domain-containing protein [Nocardia cyriacigeorgica]NEW52023.1 cupin domain-containing protein [Nocardia cyriacigeorgica]NEW55816.1 cupin domain-containing protein [Nocardia cyriacigeorgica]